MSKYYIRDGREVENLKISTFNKDGKFLQIIEGDIRIEYPDGSVKWIYAMWDDFGMRTYDSDTGEPVPNIFDLFEKSSE